jgi:hypothetical protein
MAAGLARMLALRGCRSISISDSACRIIIAKLISLSEILSNSVHHLNGGKTTRKLARCMYLGFELGAGG